MGLIEQIKEAVTIEACLSHFYGLDVPPRGRDPVMVRCPWHEDRVPSMAVWRQKGRAWCYSCAAGGDTLDFTIAALRTDLRGAIDYWASRLNLARPSRPDPEEAARLRRERELRRLRRACHRFRHAIEQGMPRPHDPDLLSAWDAAWASKGELDERAWKDGGPRTREEAAAYLSSLQAWRRRWEGLLLEMDGRGWGVKV